MLKFLQSKGPDDLESLKVVPTNEVPDPINMILSYW
jgi:hypothetical protein